VVYQLDDGTVKAEFWIVTSTSPTTIATVRTTLVSGNSTVTGSGDGPFVSKAGDFMTGPLQLPGEKSEIRRGVYDRIVNAVITVAISAAIAMHDRWSFNGACRAFQAFLILQFSVLSSQFPVLSS